MAADAEASVEKTVALTKLVVGGATVTSFLQAAIPDSVIKIVAIYIRRILYSL
jgi:hypothetical protein